MASASLSRTQVTATNRNIFTVSMWVKQSKLGSQTTAHQYMDFYVSADIRISIYQMASDQIAIYMKGGGYADNIFYTTAVYRDTSAWYHFVWRFDTTQSTAADRVRMYVNGEQVTSFVSSNYPAQNFNLQQGTSSYTQYVGRYGGNTNNNFDGQMAHVHFTDGYSYAPTVFGETDATTGIWKPKTSPSVTYGNNGFFLKFDNSGNMGLDSSGNSNNLTTSGTIIQNKDTPSNVFATINPLFVNDNGDTNALTDVGNTYTSTTRGEWNNMTSTLGATTGKWYWEVKYTQLINASTIYMSSEGVASTDLAPANHNLGEGSRNGYGYGWLCGNRNTTSNTRYLKTVAGTSTLTTDSNNTPVVAGDIVGVAWDATNGKLWFHKNGTYIDDLSGNVGNPSSDAYPYHTGMQTGILYTVWSDAWQNATGTSLIKSYNFGNGFFGTTAVTSAQNPDDGVGIFEYDVPAGYRALCTKSINAQEYS